MKITISPTIEPPGGQLTNWRTIILKKFSHCWESSRSHNRLPKRDRAKTLRIPRESDFEGQWDLITEFPKDWENRLLGGQKQNVVCTRTQEKGEVTPQETESHLPLCVWESLTEAWVDSGLLQSQEH